MDEALAGLAIAGRTHGARRRGERVPFVSSSRPRASMRVAHAGPLLEPGDVVADAVLQRASDAMHLVDLDAGHGAAPRQIKSPMDER